MRHIFSIAFCLCLLLTQRGVKCASKTSLYDAQKDHMEILDKNNFDSVVFDSDKISFVEFYAHWCGACQRYSKHWKEVALETILWHSTVARIAAINCGDQENYDICKSNNIEHYPTLKVFRAKASKGKYSESIEVKTGSTQEVIDSFVKIISEHEPKLDAWPVLTPYTSKSLKNFFAEKNFNEKYGFLIVEKSDSNLGCKLILDFAALKDKVLIKRVFDTNQPLLATFELNPNSLPVVFLITKTKSTTIIYEKLDQNLLKKYVKLNGLEGELDTNLSNDLTNEKKMSALMGKFIKLNSMISKDYLSSTDQKNSEKNTDALTSNKIKDPKETYVLSPNVKAKLHMVDLESGLNIMLRSDIGNFKSINGEKLTALKEWLRILKTYFPGRRVVRNFLNQLYEDVSPLDELTSDEWVKYSLQKKSTAFLPEVVQWHYCLGSEPKYRGYPCSLWSIFHVLTVSHIELEKAKSNPFKDDFNVKEVFEGIRLFVAHFFTCKECVDNFLQETSGFASVLNEPNDAVKYLWQVHNKVNVRLAKDHSTDQDPAHLKTYFPSKEQCPKCHLNEDESTPSWNTGEVLSFLTSVYSKRSIVITSHSSERIGESQFDNKIDDFAGKDVATSHTKSDFMIIFVFVLAVLFTFG